MPNAAGRKVGPARPVTRGRRNRPECVRGVTARSARSQRLRAFDRRRRRRPHLAHVHRLRRPKTWEKQRKRRGPRSPGLPASPSTRERLERLWSMSASERRHAAQHGQPFPSARCCAGPPTTRTRCPPSTANGSLSSSSGPTTLSRRFVGRAGGAPDRLRAVRPARGRQSRRRRTR